MTIPKLLFAATLTAAVTFAGRAAADAPRASDIVAKMAATNESLQSYKVRIHFDVDLHSFITMHPTLDGTYYYKKPDKAELDFDTVPVVAQEFKHFYASMGSPSTWGQAYDISLASVTSDGGRERYTLKLVPKHDGNVDHMLVATDSSDYAIVREQWFYRNGGVISMDEHNQRLGEWVLPKTQTADFKLPSYQAHVVSAFGKFELNAKIADSVFGR
ncbi:MAG: hypothetical protein GIW99_08145 [Candidatus Eremiobacteraeota bacterium]|nr:hypothetical protein [Candidatus Eremiobacteraeota bacterium]MBC5827633.1 hypothetical protein [Candidatus Eremiobacteraeota bacterium]